MHDAVIAIFLQSTQAQAQSTRWVSDAAARTDGNKK
jgi:hypothetical protein